MRHRILAVALIASLTGCKPQGPPVPPPLPKPVAPPVVVTPQAAPPAAPVENQPAATDPKEEPKPEPAPADAEPKPEPPVAPDSVKQEAAPDGATKTAELAPGQSKRLLLYTPSGPIIVEFLLRVDGRGAVEMNDAFVDQLLKLADTDGDGKTTWTEALASQRSGIPQFLGQSSNAQEFYDRDRDAEVDRSELWNLLGHGESGMAFRLEHVDGPGGTSASADVARMLDVDADGVLTLEEIDAAPAQLRLADIDDDEKLSPADLGAPDANIPQAMMNTEYAGNVATTASILDAETDWGVVQYELDQRYLMHGQFREEALPLFPELAKKLDADENGILSTAEAEILNYLTPHLRIELDFGAADAPAGKLKVSDMRSELSSAEQRLGDRAARLDWPNLTLAFSVADAGGAANAEAEADAAFMQSDQDKNGYLEEGELPEERKADFARYDANADGKVYPDELKTALRAERVPLLNRVRAVVTPGEHSLLAAIDANRDGTLSLREIQEAPKKLRASDRNGDGRVTQDEIPTRITVHFERGAGNNVATPAYAPTTYDTEQPEAPAWFRRMDHNADGDISPREFLGAPETFTRLDKDTDGLLSLEEATAKQQ
jgi:Ca2+-binding EF-hand superfamily protein